MGGSPGWRELVSCRVVKFLGGDGVPLQARALEAMWAAGDLDAPSEGVWWAGVELAPLWLDVARDCSEDGTHQQQIRDAVRRLV